MNHIAEYFATTNATQRTRTIRAAKFPKKPEVASYNQIRRQLKDALCQPDFSRDDLEFLVDRLDDKARRETGYHRDEALRCARAVRAFQNTFNPRSFTRLTITPSPKVITKKVEGVKLNVSLDGYVTATKGETTNCGGIVLLYAFSADRTSQKERLITTSGLVLWALEGGQMEPLPRLCMTADLAEHDIVKASSSYARFRERVAESCKEIAARWDDVEPPSDYDGPDWR